ncbi:Hpt domain-containing protein [Polaromonas sp. YR568]|uniref:Hpt domain-containing protein n=1 Tax=Polaromonas sp. YR568 TaxID=1855301 RepID=UPI00398BBCEE
MTRNDPALLAFMEEQRADYTRSLPLRLAQIAALWQQVLNGEDVAQALPTLERHAHGIAGSAATFGWAELGLAAQALELAVHPYVEAGQAPPHQDQAGVSLAVEELQRRFHGAA